MGTRACHATVPIYSAVNPSTCRTSGCKLVTVMSGASSRSRIPAAPGNSTRPWPASRRIACSGSLLRSSCLPSISSREARSFRTCWLWALFAATRPARYLVPDCQPLINLPVPGRQESGARAAERSSAPFLSIMVPAGNQLRRVRWWGPMGLRGWSPTPAGPVGRRGQRPGPRLAGPAVLPAVRR